MRGCLFLRRGSCGHIHVGLLSLPYVIAGVLFVIRKDHKDDKQNSEGSKDTYKEFLYKAAFLFHSDLLFLSIIDFQRRMITETAMYFHSSGTNDEKNGTNDMGRKRGFDIRP